MYLNMAHSILFIALFIPNSYNDVPQKARGNESIACTSQIKNEKPVADNMPVRIQTDFLPTVPVWYKGHYESEYFKGRLC